MPRRPLPPVLSAFLALLAACGGSGGPEPEGAPGAGAPAKRQVVVLSPHGQEILDQFEKLFEAAHPDIDMTGRFLPTGQILGQLGIDKDSPKADVWWGGTSAFFNQAKEKGLIAPYKPTWAEALPAGRHDAGDYWHAQFLQVPAVMFNSNLLKAEDAPSTWAGLLEPRWKEKIVIREPMDSGTMKTIFAGMVWELAGPSRDPAAGYDFLKKLDAQTRTYLPNPQALYDRVAKSPEGYISLWNVTDIVFQAKANGYPFGFRAPSGPVPVSVDPIAIVAGAPHPEEAKLFYEFATSAESCGILAREHYRIPARTDIPREQWAPEIRELQFSALEADPAEFDKLQAEWMEHWRSAIRDPGK